MNITTQSSIMTDKSTRTNIKEHIDDITNMVDSDNKTSIIILAVTLPTLACIALLVSLIVCYRRCHATIWSKKLGNLIIICKY